MKYLMFTCDGPGCSSTASSDAIVPPGWGVALVTLNLDGELEEHEEHACPQCIQKGVMRRHSEGIELARPVKLAPEDQPSDEENPFP